MFGGLVDMFFGGGDGGISDATNLSVQGQQKGLDYIKRLDAPLVDYRNQALGGLSNYYMGGPEGQQSFYDNAMQSPAYQNLINTGEQAVLRNAAATGGLRSGAVQPALAQNSQNVLQGLVNQNLMGLQGFANPNLNTGNIAQMYGNIGNTQAEGATAANQYKQNQMGNLIQTGLGIAGLFSDKRLKKDIKKIGEHKGFNIYSWSWNDLAKKLGLKGSSTGVIAQEVQKTNPEYVDDSGDYLKVYYSEVFSG
tara:strand:+ start:2564 stop:3316 length:753 start_codon:yes stop_codon:yes gene_type:complete